MTRYDTSSLLPPICFYYSPKKTPLESDTYCFFTQETWEIRINIKPMCCMPMLPRMFHTESPPSILTNRSSFHTRISPHDHNNWATKIMGSSQINILGGSIKQVFRKILMLVHAKSMWMCVDGVLFVYMYSAHKQEL